MGSDRDVQLSPAKAGEIMEAVIARGDLANLTPEDRGRYYVRVCQSLGLNPMTRPFDYITLNGKLTLYARKDATDQLRQIHGVSVEELVETERDGVFIVTAKVRDRAGRSDVSKGAVTIATLKGEPLANAMMKAETKAKRRATLSICGLGFLDETEIEDIPADQKNGPAKITRLPKKDARGVYSKLQGEVMIAASRADLRKWAESNRDRIAVLPEDWEDILRLQYEEKLAELRQREQAPDEAPAEVVTSTLETGRSPAPVSVVWDDPRPPAAPDPVGELVAEMRSKSSQDELEAWVTSPEAEARFKSLGALDSARVTSAYTAHVRQLRAAAPALTVVPKPDGLDIPPCLDRRRRCPKSDPPAL